MLCIYAMQADKTTNKKFDECFEILKKNKNILDYYEKVYAIY